MVAAYLEMLGDADPRYTNEPLGAASLAELTGTYTFGPGAPDTFIVTTTTAGGLMIKREGASDSRLSHQGGRVFNPAGAEAVRIRFEPSTGRATSVTVLDGPLIVSARRL
jgi:uncharacterized protein YaiE (UPF0345 family)